MRDNTTPWRAYKITNTKIQTRYFPTNRPSPIRNSLQKKKKVFDRNSSSSSTLVFDIIEQKALHKLVFWVKWQPKIKSISYTREMKLAINTPYIYNNNIILPNRFFLFSLFLVFTGEYSKVHKTKRIRRKYEIVSSHFLAPSLSLGSFFFCINSDFRINEKETFRILIAGGVMQWTKKKPAVRVTFDNLFLG